MEQFVGLDVSQRLTHVCVVDEKGSVAWRGTWIACALGYKACRDDRSVAYHRVPRLLEALALARGDGRCGRLQHAQVAQLQRHLEPGMVLHAHPS